MQGPSFWETRSNEPVEPRRAGILSSKQGDHSVKFQ